MTDAFEPLRLSLTNYDGTNDFTAYRIEWYHDGHLMDGKIQPTLSTALIGEYTARITLKSNPNTFCETTVTLSGTPCLELGDAAEDCDVSYTVAPPNALSSGITLSAGDEFTAGDFMVTVTNIISGDRAGWNGEGYVAIKVGGIVDLKRLAVTFDAAVVNSCYELPCCVVFQPVFLGVATTSVGQAYGSAKLSIVWFLLTSAIISIKPLINSSLNLILAILNPAISLSFL